MDTVHLNDTSIHHLEQMALHLVKKELIDNLVEFKIIEIKEDHINVCLTLHVKPSSSVLGKVHVGILHTGGDTVNNRIYSHMARHSTVPDDLFFSISDAVLTVTQKVNQWDRV